MKTKSRRISMLFTLLLAACMSFTLTSCDDDDDDQIPRLRETLIGTWEVYRQVGEDSDGDVWDEPADIYSSTMVLQFRADGSGSQTDYRNGIIDNVDPFLYSVRGNYIDFQFKDGAFSTRVVSITPFKLIIDVHYDDGLYWSDETLYLKATL